MTRLLCLLLPLALGGCQVIFFPFAPPDIPEIRLEQAHFTSRPRSQVRVVFSTSSNVGDYGRRYGALTGFDASHCRDGHLDPSRLVSTGLLRTRDGEQELGVEYPVPTPAPPSDADGRFRYSFSIVARNDFRFAHPPMEIVDRVFVPHDLTRDAMDLCVRVSGGSMIDRFTSPTVVLPYTMIADALARAGQPQAGRP